MAVFAIARIISRGVRGVVPPGDMADCARDNLAVFAIARIISRGYGGSSPREIWLIVRAITWRFLPSRA
jgi:hypothetical protein